ncbi:relaxase/mobilization nuclease domain-containing protein [Oscillatoria amoena NRMC-F 0135]|nr:relaxase/mobilization nuclease domain-containing protein [Oscillatoria amoena NRMC-F 0135]
MNYTEQKKRSNSVIIYHELFSIASDNRENVTAEMLQDLTREYIKLRGSDSIALAYAHHDRSHIHVHLAIHGLKYRQPTANRLSREALHNLKSQFQQYHLEKYPALDKSICEHGAGKEYLNNKEYQLKARTKRTLVKEDIAITVRECFEKAKTHHEFIELLMQHDLPHYERKGIATGVVHGNLKFRFTRLGIEKYELEKLPIDLTPEQLALEEIRAIRERTSGRDSRELER